MRFSPTTLATFTCAMSVHADNAAYLCGTEGYIIIPIPWKPPSVSAQFTIARSTPPRMDLAAGAKATPPETRTVDAGLDLYALEADHFAETIFDRRPPAVTEIESLQNMQILDNIRQQIGLHW
jgi:D-xylose 1-dehydrogenase (NADP+, D-xylono-1,5-lactone-forming)